MYFSNIGAFCICYLDVDEIHAFHVTKDVTTWSSSGCESERERETLTGEKGDYG